MNRTIALLALGLVAVGSARAEGPPTDDVTVTVTGASDAKFPEIGVEFEVKQPDGAFLLDAKKEDFHVTESGQETTIESFIAPIAREAKPITVVLVVDVSGSMELEDRIGGLKRAVATFVEQLPAGSRVAVIAFSDDVRTICPFTTDFGVVVHAVNSLRADGPTRFYDAVAQALKLLVEEPGRRAVLALTDGEDNQSQSADLESVSAEARRLGLPIHTLGLGSEDQIASGALKALASASRGQYYPAREADQLRKIYEELARRLRSSYSLTYRTTNKIPDGTLRPVSVSYRASKQVGATAVFIPGMVVPAGGWSGLFLALLGALSGLAYLPGWLGRRSRGN